MLEITIYRHLRDNVVQVNGRIYPQIAEDNSTTPYIVYTVISGIDRVAKNKNRAVLGREYRIQIDVFDKTALEAKKIRDEIASALYSLPNRPLNLFFRDAYESDTKLYRQILDFSLSINNNIRGECNE